MPMPMERLPRPERREKPERKMESAKRESELARLGGVTAASLKHPDRNEDTLFMDPKQELTIVADGVGGEKAGDVASRIVTQELPKELAGACADIQKLKGREQHILQDEVNELIRGNVPFIEEDQRNPIFAERYKHLLKEKRDYFKNLKAPREAQEMAIAMARALKKVDATIRETAKKNPDQKGMASTAVAAKLMRAPDGRTFAVLGSVGDSMIRIRRSDGRVEAPLPSDSYMEYAIAAGRMTEEEFDPKKLEHGTPMWDARFLIVMQVLGGSKEPVPRVTVTEVHPGDRLLLASDGLDDNDLDADYERTLGEKASGGDMSALAERMRARAEEGIARKEGKGWDDITAVVMEVKGSAEEIELGEEEVEIVEEEPVDEDRVRLVSKLKPLEFYAALDELNLAELRKLRDELKLVDVRRKLVDEKIKIEEKELRS